MIASLFEDDDDDDDEPMFERLIRAGASAEQVHRSAEISMLLLSSLLFASLLPLSAAAAAAEVNAKCVCVQAFGFARALSSRNVFGPFQLT